MPLAMYLLRELFIFQESINLQVVVDHESHLNCDIYIESVCWQNHHAVLHHIIYIINSKATHSVILPISLVLSCPLLTYLRAL